MCCRSLNGLKGAACDASTAADSQTETLKETPSNRRRSSMSLGFLRTGRSAWLPTHKKRESTVLCPSMSRTSAQVYTVLRKKQTKHHAWNSRDCSGAQKPPELGKLQNLAALPNTPKKHERKSVCDVPTAENQGRGTGVTKQCIDHG